jgi:hypothetical protein
MEEITQKWNSSSLAFQIGEEKNKTPIGGLIRSYNAKSNLCNWSKQRNW